MQNDIDPNKLLELAAEKLAMRMNPDRLIDKEEGAEILKCAPRYFLERIACQPGFPRAVRPGRWRYGDVVKWMRRASQAA